MYLNFEITNKQIKRKNIEDDYQEKNKCSFSFTTDEWKHKEKYVIFWTDKNKSIIRCIGNGIKSFCEIPEELTDVFDIQIYVNDDLYTNKLKIGTTIHQKESQKQCKKVNKCSTDNIFYDIYQQLEQKIDSIKYIDNVFYIYSSNKLIKTVDLYDKNLIKKLIDEELISINIDSEMSTTSVNALQNKVITEELSKKQDSSNLSSVARTGDYNDLKNKPNEFKPSKHTHSKEDLNDFDINVDTDIELMLMKITDKINGM